MQNAWSRIVGLWLVGVLAAAQLAKMSSLAPILRESYGLTLPQTGLLISLLEVGGGLFGFVAGLALGRVGTRRFLLAGLGMLAASGMLEGIAVNAPLLFSARAIEGIGYLLVVTAAPTMSLGLESPYISVTSPFIGSPLVPHATSSRHPSTCFIRPSYQRTFASLRAASVRRSGAAFE